MAANVSVGGPQGVSLRLTTWAFLELILYWEPVTSISNGISRHSNNEEEGFGNIWIHLWFRAIWSVKSLCWRQQRAPVGSNNPMEAAAKIECSDMDAWSVVEMAPSSLDLVSSMISSRNRFSQNHLPQPPTYKRQHWQQTTPPPQHLHKQNACHFHWIFITIHLSSIACRRNVRLEAPLYPKNVYKTFQTKLFPHKDFWWEGGRPCLVCFGKSQEIGSKGEGGCLHPLTDNWHALWSHQLTFNFLTMVMTISCLTIMIFRTRCDVNTLTSFRLGFLSVLCPNSLSPEITSGFPSVPFVCMHCDL